MSLPEPATSIDRHGNGTSREIRAVELYGPIDRRPCLVRVFEHGQLFLVGLKRPDSTGATPLGFTRQQFAEFVADALALLEIEQDGGSR